MIWKFITYFVRKLDPEIAHKVSLLAFRLGIHPRFNNVKIPTNISSLNFITLSNRAYCARWPGLQPCMSYSAEGGVKIRGMAWRRVGHRNKRPFEKIFFASDTAKQGVVGHVP